MSITHRLTAIAIAASCALGAAAQLGSNAYSFLEVSSSTRAQALGGYAIALSEPDVMLTDQNPGLLGAEIGSTVALSYQRWMGSSNFAALRFGHSAGERGAYAVGIRYLDYGEISGFLPDGTPNGSFRPQDIAVEGTYAHDFSDYLRGGITAKFIYSNYEEYTAMALAADLGINYYNPDNRLSLSAVIKNAGGQIKRFTDAYDHLPFDIQLGYMQGLGEGPFSLAVTAHNLTHWHMPYYRHPDNTGGDTTDIPELADNKFAPTLFRHLAFGLQYSPSEKFYIALGYNYKTRTDMTAWHRSFLSGFSAGVGLNVKDFGIGLSFSQPHRSATSIGLNLSYFI